ncbi:MAG: DUF4124 domain-containing protein [Methylophilaceae bacterium]
MYNLRSPVATSALLFLAALCVCQQAIAAESNKQGSSGKIVKWVDEKGITHYGDSIPAQYSGRDNTVINSRGIVIQRNVAAPAQATAVAEKNQELARRDRALLASYTTQEEIDLARDRNLQMDEITITGLKQRREGTVVRLGNIQKRVDGFNNRKKPLPDEVNKELLDTKTEINNIDEQIKQRLASMDATRARFDIDKQRFISLKEKAAGTKTED